MPCLQVSCVHQGQKSCFIEHSRLIILRNDTGSPENKDFPRVSLYYEYIGDRDISRVPALSLADDGPGRHTGSVLPMLTTEVRHCPSPSIKILHAGIKGAFLPAAQDTVAYRPCRAHKPGRQWPGAAHGDRNPIAAE